MKFATTESPDKRFVLARLFAGETFEDRVYSGTLVLPSEDWERMLDCLVYGAAHMTFNGAKLQVYFGPDDGE